MKKLLGVLIFAAMMLLGSTAHAWIPSGWHYMQWPYVYSLENSSWMYLNEANNQLYYDFSTGTWSVLGAGGAMDNGWAYFQWPYAYALSNNRWHYMDEGSVMLAYSFTSGIWSQLGVVDSADIKHYLDTAMGLLSGGSTSVISDQLGAIVGAVFFGTSSTCPTVTVSPPLTDLSNVASPTVITADYGSGCTPSGSTSVMSGSAVLTITNFTYSDTAIAGNFLLSLNNLAKDGTVLGNGTISGSLQAVPNNYGTVDASISLTFNVALLNNQISGQISFTASDIDLSGGSYGPITVGFNNFSAGNFQINSGSVVVTSLSQTDTQSSTQVVANLSTSQGAVNVSLLETTSGDSDQVIQLRTTQTGTICGYSIAINDVTLDSSVCSSYPSSGTISLSKSGTTTNIGFTSACDGTYIFTQN